MSLSLLLWSAYERLWTLPTSGKDLSGRAVIITGANTGLGFEAAKSFYAMNPARLILAVRSTSKGQEAKKTILSSITKSASLSQDRGETNVEVWELDLASFDSVKRFSQKCLRELGRLDILVENAGIWTTGWTTTVDGWESGLQTNVISTFLLATLLMPLMEKTAKMASPVQSVHLKPHLVILASDVHRHARFPQQSASHSLNALNDETQFEYRDRYLTTKLLDVVLTRQLAQNQMFKNGKVVLCSLTPGLCRSELMRNASPLGRWILYNLFARTTEEGAKNLVWASLDDNIPPGAYVASCAVTAPSRYVLSEDGTKMQKKLWKELGDVVLEIAPETKGIWNA